ncbi:MAG: DUF2238 domain-containing protein [Hahellaceae bacterium]|nr:DUF2238 domain-containing protein [Hahellaceae bacterium]MCP5168400.1 DUF2238 domain-containing protein [Hahellaceae bacterium]
MVHRIIWLCLFVGVFIWSAVNPKDLFTWFLEVFPAMVALVLMVMTYRRFPLTPLLYWLILIHAIILMVGGHYTYAEVPLFDWLKTVFDGQRNNYDKVGHFAQGFVPAMVAREILIRRNVLAKPQWMYFLVVCICLAISAFYELIEWGVALLSGQSAEAFLGTQGYIWDTQSDMALALLGAIMALLTLNRWHDAQIDSLARARSR